MIGASGRPLALPRSPSVMPRAARGSPRNLATPLRVLAFAALSAYVAGAWLATITDPPAGRAALAVIVLLAYVITLVLLGGDRVSRRTAWVLAFGVSLIAIAVAAITMGLPARLIAPWHWGELATNLSSGWAALWNVQYPYDGTVEWTRLVILVGLPLVLGVAGALAFWPAGRASPVLRAIALVVLVGAYGAVTTISPPSAPLLAGAVLLLLVWAWLWLPGRGGREALAGGALILAAGVLALPIATSLGDRGPLVDYRSWGSGSPQVGSTESFVWDQTYGPLTWPRVGRTLFEVRSDGPYYWRTAVLDEFDGASWVQSDQAGSGALQLPERPSASGNSPRLNPDWIHELEFTIRGLHSDLVVGAGTPLGMPTLNGVTAMERGLVLPSNEPLSDGESYVMRSYVPDPSPAEMRNASTRYPGALARDTVVTLPGGRSINVPFWGAPTSDGADRALASSVYGGVYRLARRVTARASSPYEAVSAIEAYLGSHYRYSEFAPIRHLALRTFLLGARRGYCQHFSGAMALMLRMVGIPARVAAGFSPGRQSSDGNYVVTDFDAHSWVETYFSGIGWVTFDPTPAGTPARSRVSGLGASLAAPSSRGGRSPNSNTRLHRGAVDRPTPNAGGSQSRQPAPLTFALAALVLLAIIGGGLVVARRGHRRALGSANLTDAQLLELTSALEAVRSWETRGATLLSLERRLTADVGPGAAAYVARIRAARYAPGHHPPPGMSPRAVLRRELASGLGLRGRLLSLYTIPPGRPGRTST